jgi:hypothetical protein
MDLGVLGVGVVNLVALEHRQDTATILQIEDSHAQELPVKIVTQDHVKDHGNLQKMVRISLRPTPTILQVKFSLSTFHLTETTPALSS